MLLHGESICSAHNPPCSAGKVGVVSDRLADAQTGGQGGLGGFTKSHMASKVFTLDHTLFLQSRTSLTLAARLCEQENVTNSLVWPAPERGHTEVLLEVRQRPRELPDVRISPDGSNTAFSQVLSKTGSLEMGLFFGLAPSQPRPSSDSPNG